MVQREAEFARALTVEFGFDALAETVLDNALKTARGEDQAILMLARCDLRKAAAARAQPEDRLQALTEAAQAYAEFLEANTSTRLGTDAQVAFGELAFNIGSTLESELDSVSPERRAEIIQQMDPLFSSAKDGIDAVIVLWEGLEEGDERDSLRYSAYFPASFYKAIIYYYWGYLHPATSTDRKIRVEKSIELLENFAFLVGENTPVGLRAYRHVGEAHGLLAKTYRDRGDEDEADSSFEDAELYLEHVTENGIMDATDMTQAELDLRREVMQEAYFGLLHMYRSWGKLEKSFQIAEGFLTWVEEESVVLASSGYRLLLEVAQSRIAAGNYDAAIALAEQVARENERSRLRLEADAVMGKAIAAAPSDFPIDLKVLYSAAEGAYFRKEFSAAQSGFLLLLARLENSRQADEFGARSYYYLGRAYTQLDRRLEASIAHQVGYQGFPDDELFAAKNANSWMKLAEQFRSAAAGDEALDAYWKEAVVAVTDAGAGGAPDQAQWNAASSDYQLAKDACRPARGQESGSSEAREALRLLDRAIASYRALEKSSSYFERAQVQIGMCEYRKMAWAVEAGDRAFEVFDDYLEVWVANPENRPQTSRGRKYRLDATAQADFYRGQVLVRQAEQNQAGAWENVVKIYAGYPERHPDQRDYIAAAYVSMIRGHIALGQIAPSTETFQTLSAADLSPARVAQGAHALYSHWSAAGKAATEEAVRKEAMGKAADYLGISNRSASRKNWQNLLQEARIRLKIDQPANASRLLSGILEDFAEDASLTETHRFFLRMDLVEAEMAQFRTAVAGPIVEDLLEERPTNLRAMQAAVKVLGGWAVLRNGKVIEVPGADTEGAADRSLALLTTLTQIAEHNADLADINKFDSPDYWQARLQYAYLLYRRAKVDPSVKGKHIQLIESLKRLAPDLGEAVAGKDTRRIFLWLESRS